MMPGQLWRSKKSKMYESLTNTELQGRSDPSIARTRYIFASGDGHIHERKDTEAGETHIACLDGFIAA
jgi:hypothetical protein